MVRKMNVDFLFLKKLKPLGVGLLLFIPTNGTANDRFIQQVGKQLIEAAMAFEELADYEPTHEPYVRKLYRSDSFTKYVTLQLDKDTSYAILGVCDEDCTDIDLHLYDEGEHLVDKDIKPDDKAIVTVTPKWTGEFHLKVTLPKCSAYRCTVGIGVFGDND